MVRSFNELKKRWDGDVSVRHYHPGIVIKDAWLVLGADTILVRMGATCSGAKTRAVEADRERLLTLLGVSYGHRVPPGAVKNIENASEQWQRGERVFSAYSFGFHGLAEARKHG